MNQIFQPNSVQPAQQLTPGARSFGAAICAALAACTLVIVARDMTEIDPVDLFWMWVYGPGNNPEYGAEWAVSSQFDVQLLVLFVAGIALSRSAAALPGLVTIGAVTVVVRAAPLLALVGLDAYDGVFDIDYGKWAVLTLLAELALGLLLLVVAAAGRRPAGGMPPGPGYPGAPMPGPQPRVMLPKPVGALGAAVGLGAVAALTVAWQLYYLVDREWKGYKPLLTGEIGTVRELTEVQPAVYGWTLGVLCAVGALAALRRSPASRPIGLTAGWLLIGISLLDIIAYVDAEIFFDFGPLPTPEVLWQLSCLLELLVGLAVLGALAQGEPADGMPLGMPPGGAPGYQPTMPAWNAMPPGQPGPAGPGGPGWGPSPQPGPPPPQWGPPPPQPGGNYGYPPADGRQGW